MHHIFSTVRVLQLQRRDCLTVCSTVVGPS